MQIYAATVASACACSFLPCSVSGGSALADQATQRGDGSSIVYPFHDPHQRRDDRGSLEPAGPGQRVRRGPGGDRPVSECTRLDHDVSGHARRAECDRAEVSTVRVLRNRPVRRSDRRRGAGCPRRHEPHLSDASGENDAELAFWLGQVPDGSRKTNGINLGVASAAAIINARANDNMLVGRRIRAAEPTRARRLPLRSAAGVRLPARIRHRDAVRHRLGADFLPDPPPSAHQPGLRHINKRDQGVGPISTARSAARTRLNFSACGGSSSMRSSGADHVC